MIASVVGLVLVGSLIVLVTDGSGGGGPDSFDGSIDRGLKVRTGKELETYLLAAGELTAGLTVKPESVESDGTYTDKESPIPALTPCAPEETAELSLEYPIAQAAFNQGTEWPLFSEVLMVFPKKMAIKFMNEYESQYAKCKEYKVDGEQRVSVTVERANFGDSSLRMKAHNLDYDPTDSTSGSDAETLLVRVGGTIVFMSVNSAGGSVPSDVLEKLASKAVGKIVNGG
ncbi:hypothetical protein GCM10022254_20730 [Actinomadura meridiana]|uniref:PknH-like extracellular domain-containing protein n=1 Tax=Actinomadura meridiana TaxID=559626 RepID=A0ABP8BX32_9ACTN